jgi:hypothetical protein
MDRTIRCFAALSLLVGLSPMAFAQAAVMQTWHPWQLDSVLVAWALTQAVKPTPVFESVPRGAVIAPEQAIDTPDSPYRRTGQRTAFEEAVRQAGVVHPCVPRLREAVRIVELAAWRRPEFPQVEAFEARVLGAIPAQPVRGELKAAFDEVERYCSEGAGR